MTIQELDNIYNDNSLSIYNKKRSIITEGIKLMRDGELQNTLLIDHCRDLLLKCLHEECFTDDTNNKLTYLMHTIPAEKIDLSIINEFDYKEWDLLNSFIDTDFESKLSFYSLVLYMRKYIGNTVSHYTPAYFLMISAIFENRNVTENRIATIKNTYKKYTSNTAYPKVVKFI